MAPLGRSRHTAQHRMPPSRDSSFSLAAASMATVGWTLSSRLRFGSGSPDVVDSTLRCWVLAVALFGVVMLLLVLLLVVVGGDGGNVGICSSRSSMRGRVTTAKMGWRCSGATAAAETAAAAAAADDVAADEEVDEDAPARPPPTTTLTVADVVTVAEPEVTSCCCCCCWFDTTTTAAADEGSDEASDEPLLPLDSIMASAILGFAVRLRDCVRACV